MTLLDTAIQPLSCKTCHWWHQYSDIEGYAECRRHAPGPDTKTLNSRLFPWTASDDDCGDWEPCINA